MTGPDFLPVAARLVTGSTEAEWRTAVSRAYYAAFHVARNLLEAMGFRVPRADRSHAYLWLRLNNRGDAVVQAAALTADGPGAVRVWRFRTAYGKLSGRRGAEDTARADEDHS